MKTLVYIYQAQWLTDVGFIQYNVLYHDIKYVVYFLSDVRNFQRVIWTLAQILVLH